jgi:hypothetical protein
MPLCLWLLETRAGLLAVLLLPWPSLLSDKLVILPHLVPPLFMPMCHVDI